MRASLARRHLGAPGGGGGLDATQQGGGMGVGSGIAFQAGDPVFSVALLSFGFVAIIAGRITTRVIILPRKQLLHCNSCFSP